jgi:hypothetical protein
MKNKNYHGKRTAHWYSVTSLLLKPRKQCLTDVTSFRLSKSLYSRSILFKHSNNFGPVSADCLYHGIYETNTHQLSFFNFLIRHITVAFSLTLKTFLLFVTVAMLSHYQSRVNCRSRNIEGNLHTK